MRRVQWIAIAIVVVAIPVGAQLAVFGGHLTEGDGHPEITVIR